jgi:hypothetical protein
MHKMIHKTKNNAVILGSKTHKYSVGIYEAHVL